MGAVLIQTEITRAGLDLTPKEFREITEAGYRAAGQDWFKGVVPRHFETSAKQEYGYQPRAPGKTVTHTSRYGRTYTRKYRSYDDRKYFKFGHRQPLVWSGALKQAVAAQEDVRASSKGANVVLHGPQYLYQYRKDLNQPDKSAELTAVSERDSERMHRVLDQTIQKEIDRREQDTRARSAGGHRMAGLE